jgi:CheY-like chemotaxis protein
MEGFQVITASDGQSGLAMIHENPPDLILCDIIMPALDGFSVLEAMKKKNALESVKF